MSNNYFEPERLRILTESKQIKGYVHPTRITILNMLAREKRTISSIAKDFGVHPANITHHFKLMEKVGLIRLVEKRDNGKNLEKYYRAVAYDFVVKPEKEGKSNKKALALSILRNDLSVAINTIKQDEEREVIALLGTARLRPKDVNRFVQKLKKLSMEFRDCSSENGVTQYNINLSLYPNDAPCSPSKEIIID